MNKNLLNHVEDVNAKWNGIGFEAFISICHLFWSKCLKALIEGKSNDKYLHSSTFLSICLQFTLFITAVLEVPSLLMRFESKVPLRVPSFWISKE
jgi:hypothetical protein